jgi:acetyl esterase/lipase
VRAALAAPLLVALALAGCGTGEAAPPAPRAGAIERVDVGHGDEGAAVFRPGGQAGRLPAVLFLHGLFATDPQTYGAWIRHLVDEGNVVIYPTYQRVFTPPAAYLANTIAGVRAALRRVPVEQRTLVAVGHSAGGALAADYAAVATDLGLPPPRLVYSVYPGRGLEGIPFSIPKANPAGIPRDTRIVTLAGAEDRTVGTTVAREIVLDAKTVPRSRRSYRLVSDPRVGRHLAPLRSDAVARRVFWMPLDRLLRQDR